MTDTIQDQIKELTVKKSLRLLRDGFKNELAGYVYADPRVTDLLQEIVSEFVETNIPLVDENNQVELAMMLLETLDIVTR
jgi:hypothetical protein